ncbi:hypothetical protein [Ponticoccus alexandrii]|uniref:Uncharacterized protein n=1 Tax=Ponticoccus alexandrii TaxID=1943633 RepID=A0ABX7FIJ6_9RHOB|nr:hypothetical protein [Ponticoccus alexandrii]ETA51957.1 hypothetical protein P279_11195 [Rhodobacteraceae bacterium PD-2]QRF69162.1 hypothetical protein GQA70_22715 [Ponticoccus alexandrii]
MDIFSKREGPRPEDVRARKLISKNAGTIRKLADQISNGGFTKMRQDQARRNEQPKPEGLLIYSMSASTKTDDPDPYVRVSLNGRVVLSDRTTGRQIQMLGQIHSSAGSKCFVLATEENGYISPVSDEIRDLLAPYEGIEIGPDFTEEDIVRTFGSCLGLAETQHSGGASSVTRSETGDGRPEDESSELL